MTCSRHTVAVFCEVVDNVIGDGKELNIPLLEILNRGEMGYVSNKGHNWTIRVSAAISHIILDAMARRNHIFEVIMGETPSLVYGNPYF